MSGRYTFLHYALVVAIGVYGHGCKPPRADSQIQSLGNFAAQQTLAEKNSCDGAGRNPVTLYKGNNSDVRQALSAVPLAVQKDFFTDYDGEIILASDPLTACKNRLPAELGTKLAPDTQGCWVFNPDTHRAEIVVGQSREAILHDLVREFGFVYADISIKRKVTAQGVTQSNNVPPAQDNLARDFLLDIFNRSGNLGAVGTALGISLPAGAGTAAVTQAYRNLPATKRDFLISNVTAEAFDSVFCSDTSRTKLNAFPLAKASALSLFADIGAQRLFTVEKNSPGYAAAATFHGPNSAMLEARRAQNLDNGRLALSNMSAQFATKTRSNGLSLNSTDNAVIMILVLAMMSQLFGGFTGASGTTLPNNGLVNQPTLQNQQTQQQIQQQQQLLQQQQQIGINTNGTNLPGGTLGGNTLPTGGTLGSNTLPIGGTLGGNTTGTVTGDVSQLNQQQREMVEASNQWRAKLGLSQLTVDATMTQTCQDHANTMLSRMVMEPHIEPIIYAENVHQYQSSGYQAVFGKNSNINDCTADFSLNLYGWCNHEGHKANLEGPNWTKIGVGYAGNGSASFWCQNFQ